MSEFGCLTGRAWRVGGLSSVRFDLVRGIQSAVARKTGGLVTACCSLVCALNGTTYLRVTPKDPQTLIWAVPGNEITYSVKTNTDWNIE